jgi:hypothetical protein
MIIIAIVIPLKISIERILLGLDIIIQVSFEILLFQMRYEPRPAHPKRITEAP